MDVKTIQEDSFNKNVQIVINNINNNLELIQTYIPTFGATEMGYQNIHVSEFLRKFVNANVLFAVYEPSNSQFHWSKQGYNEFASDESQAKWFEIEINADEIDEFINANFG